MAAQGNETTYQRPEGESTQWEDIQRKLGNFAPKAKPEKAKAFKPAAERDRVADLIEAEEQEDLEQLEDDFADDSFLEQYREQRLKQLKEDAANRGYGAVVSIVREQFVAEVTQGSKDVWTVVHLYKDKVPDSAQMGECVQQLAAKYTRTKFVKIISNDCIPDYPDRNLPTLLIYKDTECKHNLVGKLPFGGRLSPEGVAAALNRLGPICNEEQIR